MLTGWIDASGAAAAAMAALDKECDGDAPLVAFDDDVLHRLPGPPPDARAARRRQHGLVWSVPELAVGATADGHDVLLLSGPEPDMAWHRFAGTVGRPRRAARRVADGGLGAYPFATPHTGRRTCRPRRRRPTCSPPAVPHQLGRRPGGHGGGARAAVHERGIPAARHLGAGPALRRVDVVPGGVGRPARRPGDGDRHHGRRRRAAPRGRAPARAPRPARRRQRRAPGDGRPVRAAVRRRRRARRAAGSRTSNRRPDRRSSCAPATSSPPRSSASCATRARADPPDATWGAGRRSTVVGHEGRRWHRKHLDKAGAQAAELESAGYSGGWTAETSHDPFLPLLLAAEHTARSSSARRSPSPSPATR